MNAPTKRGRFWRFVNKVERGDHLKYLAATGLAAVSLVPFVLMTFAIKFLTGPRRFATATIFAAAGCLSTYFAVRRLVSVRKKKGESRTWVCR